MRRDITFLALGGASLLLSFFAPAAMPVNPAWLAILLCGAPIVREAAVGLFTRFDIKADVLVSLALLASVAIGEIFAAGEIAFIMQLGSLLEERTVAKARAGIEKLVRLTPRTARRVTAAGEESIPAKAVAVGDRLRVLPGETIPVDGVVRLLFLPLFLLACHMLWKVVQKLLHLFQSDSENLSEAGRILLSAPTFHLLHLHISFCLP